MCHKKELEVWEDEAGLDQTRGVATYTLNENAHGMLTTIGKASEHATPKKGNNQEYEEMVNNKIGRRMSLISRGVTKNLREGTELEG